MQISKCTLPFKYLSSYWFCIKEPCAIRKRVIATLVPHTRQDIHNRVVVAAFVSDHTYVIYSIPG
jgi:hypothetical protein